MSLNMNNTRNYDLNLEQIPRYHYQDERIDQLMAEQKPVVIMGSKIVEPALKWNLEYLEANLGDANYTVYKSKNHIFKYYDDKKIEDKSNPNSKGIEFTPPTEKLPMKIGEFMRHIRDWKQGDDRLYLQQELNSSVAHAVKADYLHFDWDFCNSKQQKNNWGSITSNLLFISMEGNVTPCHYDEQHNLFAQIYGYKRCILFSPDHFDRMYPYPVYHPHDRQSMVDFENPDYNKFPKFREAEGCETLVGPGDVLYIPMCWWHHVESLMNSGPTVTVNFWYRAAPQSANNITYPLKPNQKMAIMRNVEKMLVDVLQDPKEVPPFLKALVLGRYTE